MVRSKTYVSDIGHFLDPDGHVIEGPPGKMGRHLALVVECGSVIDVGDDIPIPQLCRHRRCSTMLEVARVEKERIDWLCPKCGERGVLTGWHNTRYDLGTSRQTVRDDDGVEAAVPITELDAMRRRGGGLGSTRRLLAEAIIMRRGWCLFWTEPDEFEELRRMANDAGDSARGNDRRLLDRFFARMDALLMAIPGYVPEPEQSDSEPLPGVASRSTSLLRLVHEIAAENGRTMPIREDFREAITAFNKGRRPKLH